MTFSKSSKSKISDLLGPNFIIALPILMLGTISFASTMTLTEKVIEEMIEKSPMAIRAVELNRYHNLAEVVSEVADWTHKTKSLKAAHEAHLARGQFGRYELDRETEDRYDEALKELETVTQRALWLLQPNNMKFKMSSISESEELLKFLVEQESSQRSIERKVEAFFIHKTLERVKSPHGALVTIKNGSFEYGENQMKLQELLRERGFSADFDPQSGIHPGPVLARIRSEDEFAKLVDAISEVNELDDPMSKANPLFISAAEAIEPKEVVPSEKIEHLKNRISTLDRRLTAAEQLRKKLADQLETYKKNKAYMQRLPSNETKPTAADVSASGGSGAKEE